MRGALRPARTLGQVAPAGASARLHRPAAGGALLSRRAAQKRKALKSALRPHLLVEPGAVRPKKVLASLGGYDQRAARSPKMDFRIELDPVSSKRANTVYTPISVPHDVVFMRARMLASWNKKRRCSVPTKALAAIKDHCSCCCAGALRGKACRSCPASLRALEHMVGLQS